MQTHTTQKEIVMLSAEVSKYDRLVEEMDLIESMLWDAGETELHNEAVRFRLRLQTKADRVWKKYTMLINPMGGMQ